MKDIFYKLGFDNFSDGVVAIMLFARCENINTVELGITRTVITRIIA